MELKSEAVGSSYDAKASAAVIAFQDVVALLVLPGTSIGWFTDTKSATADVALLIAIGFGDRIWVISLLFRFLLSSIYSTLSLLADYFTDFLKFFLNAFEGLF